MHGGELKPRGELLTNGNAETIHAEVSQSQNAAAICIVTILQLIS